MRNKRYMNKQSDDPKRKSMTKNQILLRKFKYNKNSKESYNVNLALMN